MFKILAGSKTLTVDINGNHIEVDGENVDIDLSPLGEDRYHLILHNKSYNVALISIDKSKRELVLKVNNNEITVVVKTALDELLAKMGLNSNNNAVAKEVAAPMPGLILDINVTEGEQIKKGDKLFILEAMKMENIIKSIADGQVKSIMVKVGDSVESGQKLIHFE